MFRVWFEVFNAVFEGYYDEYFDFPDIQTAWRFYDFCMKAYNVNCVKRPEKID